MKNELEEEQDLRVDVVGNGVDAVINFINNRYDAVLLDVSMPKLDGFGVIQQLRADPQTCNLPVIVLSAKDLTAVETSRLKETVSFVMKKQGLQGELLAFFLQCSGDVFIAGGVESMSRAPWSFPKAAQAFPFGNVTAYDTALGWRYPNPKMIEKYGIDSMGGAEGPWGGGEPCHPGVLVAGTNCVNTDAVAAAVMGYDPMARGGESPFTASSLRSSDPASGARPM